MEPISFRAVEWKRDGQSHGDVWLPQGCTYHTPQSRMSVALLFAFHYWRAIACQSKCMGPAFLWLLETFGRWSSQVKYECLDLLCPSFSSSVFILAVCICRGYIKKRNIWPVTVSVTLKVFPSSNQKPSKFNQSCSTQKWCFVDFLTENWYTYNTEHPLLHILIYGYLNTL